MKKLTSGDSGLYLGGVEQQFLGGRCHCDLLSSPVQSYIMYEVTGSKLKKSLKLGCYYKWMEAGLL